MNRIHHPYWKWEEIDFNMWGESKNKQDDLRKAVIFTGNHRLYGIYMRRVINEWPYSCENALSNLNLNRKAWLGHAAVAMALRIPEDIVRQAWSYLSDTQREKANEQASKAISQWEQLQGQTDKAHSEMGSLLLF